MKWLPITGFLLFFLLHGCGRTDSAPVAEFDGGSISRGAFADRYGRYMQSVSGQRDNILLRREILNNMINEQLILADLQVRGFNEEPETQDFVARTRAQAMLDRYARLVSTDTMQVTDLDLSAEFRAYNTRATVRYLYSPTEPGAWELKRRLTGGETFGDLAKECFRDPGLANNGGLVGSFGYGEMEPVFEQVAFHTPIREVSDPFPMRVGYGVLKVESREINPLASENDFAKVRPELAHTVMHRKAAAVLSDLSRSMMKTLDPRFEPEAVTDVFRHWDAFFSGGSEFPGSGNPADRRLVSFNGGDWTVGQFAEDVRWTSERQQNRVQTEQDVRDVVTGLLVRNELLRKARDKGLEDDPAVVAQTESLVLEYRLKQWRSRILDSTPAPDEVALRAAYEDKPEFRLNPPQVNVAEVLVRTKDEADAIASKARSGSDFAVLARSYSIRVWAAGKGGELGFGTTEEFGPLTMKFLEAPVGKIVGPEFVDPYYGVFKVLGKRQPTEKTFDEAKASVQKALETENGQEALAAALQDLRQKSKISIDLEMLATIQVAHQPGNQES